MVFFHSNLLLLLFLTTSHANGKPPPSDNDTLVALSNRTVSHNWLRRGDAQKRRGLKSGACGGGSVGNGICDDGSCCSEWGYCGTSPEHCASSPSPPTATPPTARSSTGPCGGGSVGNGICDDGSCCSGWGFCGTSPEHCGCGGGSVGNGICVDGSCCSEWGWCGTSPEHCHGPSPPAPPTQPPPTRPPVLTPTPTSSPTTTPPPQPTTAPTVTNGTAVNFTGIINALSTKKGIIDVRWDGSLLEDSDVIYDVFVALGDYDFNATLANMTVDALIEVFENDTSFEHYTINNDTNTASISSSYYGENHTLLVTAQVDGVYSSNRNSRKVVVARVDPHMKDDINVVGLFVPTTLWTIELEDAPNGTEHNLKFAGAVSLYAQNLTAGDFVTGFSTEIRPFVRRVVEVLQSTPDLVALKVINAGIEDIFDELEVDGGFEITGSSINTLSARRLRRRLGFLDDIGGAFQAIGDAVTGVVEDIGEVFVAVAGGEILNEFDMVDINLELKEEVKAEVAGNNTSVSATLTVMGAVSFQVSLFAKIRLAAAIPYYAEVGAKVDWSAEASMEMTSGIGAEYSKDFQLWEGQRRSRLIMIGPVPFEVYAQPKIDVELKAEASLEVSCKVGASAKGGTQVSLIADGPAVRDASVPPFLETNFEPPTLKGEASVIASATIVLSLDTGIYEGFLAANIGLAAGIGAEVKAGLEVVKGEAVPTIEVFDISLGFSIPFSATAFWDVVTIAETTFYEKKWPILTLPAVKLEVLNEHRCLLIGSGISGAAATLGIQAVQDYDALIGNSATIGDWDLTDPSWFIKGSDAMEVTLERDGLTTGSSPPPEGTITVMMQPQVPPLLKIVMTMPLQSFVPAEAVECTEAGPCDGDEYFDTLAQEVGAEFNSRIFLSYQPDPALPLVPSAVYKFEDFMSALKKLQGAGEVFQFWLGDDGCNVESQKVALVNMAAFLGQSMRETIIYDACDENNWDLWRADIFKEPTSPPENLAALYPMSSGCGQLGQKYAEYDCEDACPSDLSTELTATTNAGWIGAPPPLFCGPKSKYDGLGYWNSQQLCPDDACATQPFNYPGQTAGVHIPVSEDDRFDRFPEFFYTNPLPDASGNTPEPRPPDQFPATNVEGCCWWGRGVIQTTGRCNFGKLNKYLGAGAGSNALYPDINFCQNPQAICDGPSDLKWIAGIFFWVSEKGPQAYDSNGFNYKDGVRKFVSMGCVENMDNPECDFLFEYASGIVNRGCHDPGTTGCLDCEPGATCGPAHHVPERVEASKQALQALILRL